VYPANDNLPVQELKAFDKLSLDAAESKITVLKIPVAELQKWDAEKHKLKLFPGTYTLKVGRNAADKAIEQQFVIK
jgi:beta-glucosidase